MIDTLNHGYNKWRHSLILDYKTEFGTVTRLSDKDVLLIKKTLQLNLKYPTENNKIALDLLSKKVHEILGLETIAQDKVKFLRLLTA